MNQVELGFELMVVAHIQNQARMSQRITEESVIDAIAKMATAMAAMYTISDVAQVRIRERLLSRYQITMDIGVVVAANHEPWLAKARRDGEISDKYWSRYQQHIGEKMGNAVMRSLDASTDRIVDLFGDPRPDSRYLRRGLVIGDVQSGKTANYIGLCCKAADVGYRLIVLLTGTIEHLRQQTQERLDSGFVGFETRPASVKGLEPRKVFGVGLIDPGPQVQVLTTTDSDFTLDMAEQVAIDLNSAVVPTLLVTKKNHKNLGNILQWVSRQRPPNGGLLRAPLLVIDDESDNASVNTAPGEDPNTINRQIRELLQLSNKATYLGVTATPFANVFTRHDSYKEMLGDGLFPKEFIYSLDPPSNYVGAARIFLEDDIGSAASNYEFVQIEDAENWLPLKHRINAEVEHLPESLRAAICRFIVAVAIRDLRGTETSDARSMMITVSRFTGIQNKIRQLVAEYVESLSRDVQNYPKPETFVRLESAAALFKAYSGIVAHCKLAVPGVEIPPWETVCSELKHTLVDRGISVDAVNSDNAVGAMSFRQGERRIVVGGNSLSRGITLEGLCVSYFHRKPLAKDTLLQMGRWFGYRDGYEDLCALYISDDSQGHFAEAHETSTELRELVSLMNERGQTPEHFGLRVRHHPGSLAITARNKMRNAAEFEATISFSGILAETSRLEIAHADKNLEVVREFCRKLASKWSLDETSNAWLATKVPKAEVAELIRNYRFHHSMYAFQPVGASPSPASEMVDRADTGKAVPGHDDVDMAQWDIAVVQGGEEEAIAVPGVPSIIKPRLRTCTFSEANKTLLVSGTRVRLGEPRDEAIGLDKVTRASLVTGSAGKSVSGQQYRYLRSKRVGRPLLVINFLRVRIDGDHAQLPPLMVGLEMSFPYFDDIDSKNVVHYRRNTVDVAQSDQIRAAYEDFDE
jgi:hypothetical protein